MSVDSLLDSALTLVIGKAHQEFEATREAPIIRPATININFGGGGLALSVGRPCMARIPFPCVIQSIEVFAGDEYGSPVAVTAIVDLWTTTLESFSGSGQTALNSIGSRASLSGSSANLVDLTGWIVNLEATDRLVGRIDMWTGTATWLAVLISVLPTEVPQGTADVVDGSGGNVVDGSGNQIVFKN